MSSAEVPAHLDEEALLPLWRAVHDRLSSGTTVRSVTVRNLDEASQEALADLLGLASYPGRRAKVGLDRLNEVLAPSGMDARAVVAALIGPVADRAADRARAASERELLWSWLGTHPVVTGQPALLRWVEHVRADGVPSSGPGVLHRRLEQALAVVAALPLADGRPLPDLAAEVTGDPHSLDGTKALPGLVLRALAALRNEPVPQNAQERRRLWAAFGVDCDAHSSTVLVLGLRPQGADPLAQTLRVWAGAGQAAVVTLDQISRTTLALGPAPVVYVVENPSVLALAQQRLGSECPPLVCVSGWPGSAAVALLQQLASDGVELRYHGDFDGEGLRIAAHVMARTGALPWRMGAKDYQEALSRMATAPPPGRMTPVPWDGELHEVIAERGMAVHEERVTGTLLSDLRASAAAR